MIAVVAACCLGLALAGVSTLVVPPDRVVRRRVGPYVRQVRHRTSHVDAEPASTIPQGALDGFLLAPFTNLLRRFIEQGIDAAHSEQLSTRLRRAGELDARPGVYRDRQLRSSVVGATLAALVLSWFSWTVGGFWPVAAIAGLIVGLPGGAMSYRSRLEQQAARRARILRLEVYSITVALSVLTRAGVGPFGALRQVAARANGVLAHDLRLGLSWMERGADGTEVLERLARESPEPAVGRLLRVLASSNATGRNPAGALRDLAEQLRRQRIEQLDQWSTKRRAAMLLPTVLLMFPVLLLYVLAPGALVLLGL